MDPSVKLMSGHIGFIRSESSNVIYDDTVMIRNCVQNNWFCDVSTLISRITTETHLQAQQAHTQTRHTMLRQTDHKRQNVAE